MLLKFPDDSTYQVMMDTNLRSGMFLIDCRDKETQFQMIHPSESSPYIMQITQGGTQICIGMKEGQHEAFVAAVNGLEHGSVGMGESFGDTPAELEQDEVNEDG